ncbi:MAG: hypothetical protein OXU25_07555 [Thaumarchaeota archaeon]|nr:hypothetical protein [Nitrososphaerota archaeon]
MAQAPVTAAALMVAFAIAAAAGAAHAQHDETRQKALDELGGMLEAIRSTGIAVPEPTAAQAAPFISRMEALVAEGAAAGRPAEGALEARAATIMAEYALAALERAERTPGTERAAEFLARLAAISERHAEAAASGASTAAIEAERDALLVENGLLFAAEPDADDKMEEMEETIELIGNDGQVTRLTGEDAASFIRRSDDIGMRYAEATDMAPSESRTDALIALEAEYAGLLEEYGASTAPPASAPREDRVEFTNSDGEVVKLEGERAVEFLGRLDDIALRYSEAYSMAPSASRTDTLMALEAEHDRLLDAFGLGSEQPPADSKPDDHAPQGTGDEPATS